MNINNHIKKIKDLVPGQMSTSDQASVLNTLEAALYVIEDLKATVQSLKDEVNRLKGEQGKPDIAAKNQKEKEEKEEAEEEEGEENEASQAPKEDISSEKERKKGKGKRRKRKVKFDGSQRIDKTKTLDIADKSHLPDDIEFKGYATSHYQDLRIISELIELKRAIYYSPSARQTYTADLPDEYEAGYDYTQTLKGHVLMFKFEMGLSIPKIGDFMRMNGIDISNGTISNIILSNGLRFKEEGDSIYRSGMEAGLYSQTDTTGSRVNGENWHTHIIGNEYYSAYFTKPHKDRQTILDLLRNEQNRTYVLSQDTFELYDYLKIPKKVQEILKPFSGALELDKTSFKTQLEVVLPSEDYQRHQEKLLEGAYLATYRKDDPLHILVADDAPQYKLCALLIALCWIHIGRHFKKLNPTLNYHQELLAFFLDDFWKFYHRLKDYQQAPTLELAKALDLDFDQLFSRQTGYELLDNRIAKTKAKKKELLVVLKHPYVPLHNNASELDARKEVRYRDISYQTRTQKGTQAKDTFFTIIQTCKKLGVNAYAYILDRITNRNQMISLEELIFQKANAK